MPFVHDRAPCPAVLVDRARSDEKPGDLFDRFLGGRQAETKQPTIRDLLQALEAERQMGSAPAADHGVDLVHDHGADRAQHLAASFGCQQEIQRFWRRHQYVRRLAQHGGTLGLRRVAGAHGRRDARCLEPERFGHPPNATPGFGEVLVDVHALSGDT